MDKTVKLVGFKAFDGMKKMYPDYNFPYFNCSYNALLTLGEYYQKNTLSILCNPISIYRIDSTDKFKYEVTEFNKKEELLEELGIKTNSQPIMIDALREQITSCILDGNPIRIKIDLFYQNGREFYFGKKHGLHPVLVHGYDPSRDNIYIVDDISEYTEYCVPFTEFLEYFTENEAITDNSITQYVLKHSHSSNINEKVIQNFVSNLLLLESELFDSISNILQLADIYPFALKHEDLIETLSSTIYRKCSERYRLLKLLNLNNDSNSIKNSIIKKMDQVLDDWLLLRALSIKAIYTRNYGKKLIDNSRIILHRISKLEREYHILFYSLIHNFNFNFSAEQEFYH